jgi:rhodanese-related sulfurtransferase
MKTTVYFLCVVSLTVFSSFSFAENKAVWIDVRSSYAQKIVSVDGDIRIGLDEIDSKIRDQVPNVNTPIHLYCWLGFDAEKAKVVLDKMGYTNVKAGGIMEASQTRSEL